MAIRFSANGQEYTTAASLPTTRLFSVAFWARYAALGTGLGAFIWSLDDTSQVVVLAFGSTGAVALQWTAGAGDAVAGPTVSAGTWAKFAFTCNGNSATLYAAANPLDALSAYSPVHNFTLPSGTLTMRLGDTFEAGSGGQWLNGNICNFKMWDAELTQSQLEYEFRAYAPARTANISRWYPFVLPESADYSGLGRNLSGGSGVTWEAGPPLSWTRRSKTNLIIPWDPASVVWYSLYLLSTGELTSLSTTLALPVDAAFGYATDLGTQSPVDRGKVWDPTVPGWVFPAGNILVDRVSDVVADASCAAAWATLSPTNSAAIQARIGQLLGPYRYRYDFQPVDLEFMY